MFEFPKPPYTFATRQIVCVSCQEVFVVSEEFERNDDHPAEWRLPLDQYSKVRLRFEEERSHQLVHSQPRSSPSNQPSYLSSSYQSNSSQESNNLHVYHQESPDIYVNCPRCGADNRNWLRLTTLDQASSYTGLKRFLLQRHFWDQRFSAAYKVAWGSIIIIPIITIGLWKGEHIDLVAALLLSIFAILITILSLTHLPEWQSLRTDEYKQEFVSTLGRTTEAKLWIKGMIQILLLAIVLPLSFAAILLVFPFANTAKDDPTIMAEYTLARVHNFPYAFNREMDKFLELIEEANIETGQQEVIEQTRQDLLINSQRLSAAIKADANRQSSHLTQLIVDANSFVDKKRKEDRESIKQEVIHHLILWVEFVGAAGVFSLFMTMHSIKSYVKDINGQLPKPIFCSVAMMARIVAWEMKRSLEINGPIDHIQWISVERNQQGGINMMGLYCSEDDIVGMDQNHPTVQASHYSVSTDLWGRVVKSKVKQVRVPRPPRRPTESDPVGRDFFQGIPDASSEFNRSRNQGNLFIR